METCSNYYMGPLVAIFHNGRHRKNTMSMFCNCVMTKIVIIGGIQDVELYPMPLLTLQ